MAVDMQQRDTVGCCYYVARDQALFFLEDTTLGGVDVVEAREFRFCHHVLKLNHRSESIHRSNCDTRFDKS